MATRRGLLISAGEPSGDLHAAALVRHLTEHLPGVPVFGFGGDRMAQAGVHLVHHLREAHAIIGFQEALQNLNRLYGIYRDLVRVAQSQAALAVLVDYPGFHLRLARRLHEAGIPVVYYILPQFWSWGYRRLRSLRRDVSLALSILPFELPHLRAYGVPAHYVGHPLMDQIGPPAARQRLPRDPVIAFLPGSRQTEVRRLLPRMARIAQQLKELGYRRFLVSRAPDVPLDPFRSFPEARVVPGNAEVIARQADFAVVASGTASLEVALVGVPMVVVYVLSDLSYWLARALARVRFISLVNLISGQALVPEFVQHLKPAPLAREIHAILTSEARYLHMHRRLLRLRHLLGPPGASRRAAEHIAALYRQVVSGSRV